MVIKRIELEELLKSETIKESEQFSAEIDAALKQQWAPNSKVTVWFSSGPSDRVQVNLVHLYKQAGWNLKFLSTPDRNETCYGVEITAFLKTDFDEKERDYLLGLEWS